jgi:prepilin peptidase CpaA
MTAIDYALLGFFPTLMAFAAVSDLVSMTISNRISLLLVAGFPLLALAVGMPVEQIGWHFLAGLLVLVVTFTLFAFNLIGGGDAKLTAATAIWVGWSHLLEYVVLGSFLGGPLTMAILVARRHPLPGFLARQDWVARIHDPKNGIPYGIALAAAGLLVYPDAAIWKAALAV